MQSSPIFRLDSNGKLRTWSYEVDADRYRTYSGIHGKRLTVSGWIACTAKSQQNDEEQACFEASAEETRKLAGRYHRTAEGAWMDVAFAPMLAHVYSGRITYPVISQPKLDGIRCIATARGLFTRQGNPIIALPNIRSALAPFFALHPHAIIDGELYNHAWKADFNKIASAVLKRTAPECARKAIDPEIEYHIYDCVDVETNWLERMANIRTWMADRPQHEGGELRLVETTHVLSQGELDAYHHRYLADGYEGQMIRLPGAYEQKRSNLLLKRKEFDDDEFEIIDVVEGRGAATGCAKKLICRMPDGRRFGAGVKGDRVFTCQLLLQRSRYIGSQATVQFHGATSSGLPRFPIATKFHAIGKTIDVA